MCAGIGGGGRGRGVVRWAAWIGGNEGWWVGGGGGLEAVGRAMLREVTEGAAVRAGIRPQTPPPKRGGKVGEGGGRWVSGGGGGMGRVVRGGWDLDTGVGGGGVVVKCVGTVV